MGRDRQPNLNISEGFMRMTIGIIDSAIAGV